MSTRVRCNDCDFHTVMSCEHCATWHADTTGHQITVLAITDDHERHYGTTLPMAPSWRERQRR